LDPILCVSMTSLHTRWPVRWALLAAIYVLAAKVGLVLAFLHPSATAFWPPTGIALAAVLIFGPRVWPAIFIGAFLANEMTAGTLATSLVIAAGNTLEAVIGGYLVNRFARGTAAFARPESILRFVALAGFASTAVSATIGVTALWLLGFSTGAPYASTWLTWWLGDAAGAIVIAPAILLWYTDRQTDWRAGQRLELLTLACVLLLLGWIVFARSAYPIEFLCIPIVVWSAARFGQREAATATCILSVIAIWGTFHERGTFGGHTVNETLLLLQSFMVVTSLVGITLGASATGRGLAERELRRVHDELEERVRARSRDLQTALDELVANEEIIRRSERRLQTIIDAEPACVKLVSREGILLDMNRAGLHMIGASVAADIKGRPVSDLVHPEDRDRFLAVHLAAADGRPGRAEFRICGLDGDEHWVDSHLVPFDTPAGGNAERAVLSVTSEITERKRLEEQLRQSQKLEAIGLLAGGIAHDFNNLVTAIGGFTEMVLSTIDEGDTRRDDLQEVAKASQRAGALTRQLLAVSRRQVLQPTVVDVNAMLTDVQKLLHRTIPENIEIQLDLAPELEPVHADRGQLEQVVLNLAINAGDAMPQGGRLRLITQTVDVDDALARRRPPMPPGRYVRLMVSDTGTGMAPATQAHIFEPFFTTKTRGTGTGLGLATVYGIVKQSSGYIWVDSELGRGTTFDIYLPTVRDAAAAAIESRVTPRFVGGSQTILIAEDDGAVRRFARDVLAGHGYTVLDARDGDEALAIAQKHSGPIDLLVADVVMPGLSGRDLAARLAADRPDVRVLYMSGYSEKMIIRAGLEHGLTLLPKPFLPADLLQRVGEMLAA